MEKKAWANQEVELLGLSDGWTEEVKGSHVSILGGQALRDL